MSADGRLPRYRGSRVASGRAPERPARRPVYDNAGPCTPGVLRPGGPVTRRRAAEASYDGGPADSRPPSGPRLLRATTTNVTLISSAQAPNLVTGTGCQPSAWWG